MISYLNYVYFCGEKIFKIMTNENYKLDKETLANLASKLGVTEEEILGHCRKSELVDARCMVAAVLIGIPRVRQQDVAQLLGISQAAVSKLLKRHNDLKGYNAYYHRKWERFQMKIQNVDCATTILTDL